MTIDPIPLDDFPRTGRPWNNITPFTYRDGLTYLEVLEALRAWVRDVLTAHLNGEMEEFAENWNQVLNDFQVAVIESFDQKMEEFDVDVQAFKDAVNEQFATLRQSLEADIASQLATVNDALAAWDSTYATFTANIQALVDQWTSVQIENNDVITAAIIADPESATRAALQPLLSDGVTDAVVNAIVSDESTATRQTIDGAAVDALGPALNSLTLAIGDNGDAIVANGDAIDAHDGRISANESAIDTHDERISTNESAIASFIAPPPAEPDDGSFWRGTIMPEGNLDVTNEPGLYGYWSGTTSAPDGVSGVLLVGRVSSNRQQTAWTYGKNPREFRRYAPATGAWSAWERVDATATTPIVAEPDTDANDIDADITYYSNATNPIANLPEDAPKSGRLTTSVLIPKSFRPKLQEYVTTSPAQHWTRFSSSTWSGWTRIDVGAVEFPSGGAGSSPSAFKTVPLALTVAGGQRAGATSGSFRMPVNFAATVRRWRLHFRNNNPRFHGDGPNATISSVYFGPATTGGQFSGAPTLISSGLATDGGEAVTRWSSTPIEADTQYAVSYAFAATSTNQVVGGGWSASSVNSTTATLTRVTNLPLDAWIEAEVEPTVPVIAAFGDSLSSGISATLPVFDSWLSQYCRQHGALPVHYAASGDSMEYWSDPTHYKWQRWQHLSRPDAVVHAMGSNDVFAAGRTLEEMKSRREATMQVLADLVSPVIFSATITPRNATTGEQEGLRKSYNTWLKTFPDAARDVFDFVPAVSSDDETILPEFNTDGVHLNTAGYAALADTITRPLAALATPKASVIDARPWMISPHKWLSATRIAVNSSSVTMTISGRADQATAIPSGTVIGNIPAEYRPLVDVYAQGQNLGPTGTSEGMKFMPNGDISCPSVTEDAYFKVSATWTTALAGTITRPVVPVPVGDVEQDTGWRQLNDLVPGYTSGNAYVRRIGKFVHVNVALLKSSESGQVDIDAFGNGFAPTHQVNQAWMQGDNVLNVRIYAAGNLRMFDLAGGYGANFDMTYPTDQPWPTTLPGTPA